MSSSTSRTVNDHGTTNDRDSSRDVVGGAPSAALTVPPAYTPGINVSGLIEMSIFNNMVSSLSATGLNRSNLLLLFLMASVPQIRAIFDIILKDIFESIKANYREYAAAIRGVVTQTRIFRVIECLYRRFLSKFIFVGRPLAVEMGNRELNRHLGPTVYRKEMELDFGQNTQLIEIFARYLETKSADGNSGVKAKFESHNLIFKTAYEQQSLVIVSGISLDIDGHNYDDYGLQGVLLHPLKVWSPHTLEYISRQRPNRQPEIISVDTSYRNVLFSSQEIVSLIDDTRLAMFVKLNECRFGSRGLLGKIDQFCDGVGLGGVIKLIKFTKPQFDSDVIPNSILEGQLLILALLLPDKPLRIEHGIFDFKGVFQLDLGKLPIREEVTTRLYDHYQTRSWEVDNTQIYIHVPAPERGPGSWTSTTVGKLGAQSSLLLSEYHAYCQQTPSSKHTLKFVIETNDPTLKLDETFGTIIKSIVYSQKTQIVSDKISVYMIKIKENVTYTLQPNPEYNIPSISHQGESGTGKEIHDDESDTDEDHERSRLSKRDSKHKREKPSTPPTHINVKEVSYSVETQKVNETIKRFDTLYLREEEMYLLEQYLDTFKNSESMYENFCIRRKLGILLYGLPGTGKTSTIQAIATYLGYDIYYVSLNGITTNSQLKLIFDHILSDTLRKGMIVFEEIDTQTSVVHNRLRPTTGTFVADGTASNSHTDDNHILSAEKTMYQLANIGRGDDSLDLGYFLNVLDGTLSVEGMVVCLTTNHLETLDPALYRAGRIDVKINMKLSDHYQIKCIYHKIMGRALDETVLTMIPEDRFTPSEIIHYCLQMRPLLSLKTDVEIMRVFCQRD